MYGVNTVEWFHILWGLRNRTRTDTGERDEGIRRWCRDHISYMRYLRNKP